MQIHTPNMTRRGLLTKAAIGLPAMGVVGALNWANPASDPEASAFTFDGIWGPETTAALQKFFNTPIDGIVSGQDPTWRKGNTRLGEGWDWSGGGGSLLIREIQNALGVQPVDGIFGPRTSGYWHMHLKLRYRDFFDNKSSAVLRIQHRVVRGRF